MKTNKEEMGKRIREIRESLGLGQDELGRLTLTSKQSVSSYETGRSFPPLDFLATIAGKVGVPIDLVVTGAGWDEWRRGQRKTGGDVAATIEPGEPDARDRLIRQRAAALKGDVGTKPPPTPSSHHESTTAHSQMEKIDIHEGLLMTTRVLQSETGYAIALWSNLKSFDEAVKKEEKVKDLERKMDLLLEKMSKMEERLAEKNGATEKRDKSASA
jgi:transcriptional regulator with XRE-family HTH domain